MQKKHLDKVASRFTNVLIVLLGAFSTLLPYQASASPLWEDSKEIQQLFEKAGVTGTFVVYDVTGNKMIGYNQERARTQFIPASTFKIPHSLIGLDTGTVQSVDAVLPYGGKPQHLQSWEQDMSLRDAIKLSNVPIYQELARRITLKRMQDKVKAYKYGTMNIGDTVDQFWLKGPLKISAIEQVEFLSRLAQSKLPASQEAQGAVHDITLLQKGESWELHAKTGTMLSMEPAIGWWVGWVRKGEKIYCFALNINAYYKASMQEKTPVAMEARIALGEASLAALKLMDD